MSPKLTFFSTIIIILSLASFGRYALAADTSQDRAQQEIKTISPSLAKSITAAIVGHKVKKLFLVDVRPAAEFDKYHIAGSINIPLHALKTKTFLKSKPVALVNNGYTVSRLAQTCQQLNQAGFKASILAGGLLAWKAKGGNLAGDPFALHEINHISPQMFHQEKNHRHQIVIDASDKPDKKNRPLHPGAKYIPLLKSKQASARIKKLLQVKGASPFATVIIYTATGKENNRIQRKLAAEGFQQAFFLQGGRQAYEKHLENILLARKPKEERKITTGGCKSCAQEQ